MKKWIFLIALIILAIIGYNYIYQDHRDISQETASFTLNAEDLGQEFAIDSEKSQEKYLNKTIQISGLTTSFSENTITIDDRIFCQFSSPIQQGVEKGQPIYVKGRFIGYDDLLEEIKLDQCTIINN